MNITIYGCGTLGSSIIHTLCMRNIKFENVSQITVYDDDVLKSHNLPFININNMDNWDILCKPKVEVLKQILESTLSLNLDVIPINQRIKTVPANDDFKIDCRDTDEQLVGTDLKVSFDGFFGKVIVNPEKKRGEEHSEYIYGNYQYYAMKFSYVIIDDFILGGKDNHNECYTTIYDLRSGERCIY